MRRTFFISLSLLAGNLFFLASFSLTEKNPGIFNEGSHFTYSYYDKDGKYLGKAESSVNKLVTRHDSVFSESETDWFSDTGATMIARGFFRYAKDSVSFIASLDNLVPPRISYDGMKDVNIEGAPLVYPLKPKKNTPLPGTNGVLKYMRPAGNIAMIYEITNRQLEIADTVTTQAGKFPCWIVTYYERIGTPDMKRQDEAKKRRVKEWYSPQFGIVKTEYSREGVLEMTRVLTACK